MRDPLAFDAVLVIFGGILAIVIGIGVFTGGGTPSVPAVLSGAGVTLIAVALGRRVAAPVSRWLEHPVETPRERLQFVIPVALLVLARIFLVPLLPPAAFHAMLGAVVTMVFVGFARTTWRVWSQ